MLNIVYSLSAAALDVSCDNDQSLKKDGCSFFSTAADAESGARAMVQLFVHHLLRSEAKRVSSRRASPPPPADRWSFKQVLLRLTVAETIEVW